MRRRERAPQEEGAAGRRPSGHWLLLQAALAPWQVFPSHHGCNRSSLHPCLNTIPMPMQ